MFKGSEFRCPAADALKARGYRPSRPDRRRGEPLEQFSFGPFMAACDARRPQADRVPAATKPLHDGLRQWTEHAVALYDAAFPQDADDHLTEASAPWVYRHQAAPADPRAAQEYRFTVWGRCWQSADGTLRELRLPVNRLRPQEPPAAFVAAAALVLAEGAPGPKPERVRIVEFALLDGKTRVLLDGSREAALALYRKHGPQVLPALLDSQEYRPGTACTGCAYVSVCPVLRRAPGLLGTDRTAGPRRSWSVTNGRSYRICPARDQLRRLHLPTEDAVERDPTSQRGRALHAYLADRHGGGSPRPCTADVPEQWVPDGFDLPEAERLLGVRLLRHHAAVCPLRYVRDGTDVRNEPRVVRHDTLADVLVVAEPDLLYRDGESWVWRETKTSVKERDARWSLLRQYPQLALAVLLLGRGDLGGVPDRARVELEVLRPEGPDLEIIDPFAPDIRAAAERVLHGLVDAWHRDGQYLPRPGRACTRCEVARWCSSASLDDGAVA
ncbi:PD-(D/E)XK nuclease family protein [Streptacidiphilus sp. N1-3]|uniref:PD-(D/E)XK nuclease family protein n=1 Tax=Streptacidiphilus alkalitolerans TaxID=3342712 RepID=A0ABV6WX99_9ACTN